MDECATFWSRFKYSTFPVNVWGVGDIGGVGSYSSNTNSTLVSPPFDFSTTTVANLSFWQNRYVETGWDGVRLEYSTDGGNTWTILGVLNDPNGTNWYTDASINSSTLPAWDGPNNAPTGWIQSRYKLGTVAGIGGSQDVRFRYIFTSDPSVEDAGWHFDDFCIIVPCNDDIGVNVISAPLPGSGQPAGNTTDITVILENYGQLAQSNFNIGWSINGIPQTSIPFVGTLATGSTTTFTIPNTPVDSGNYTICVWTELVGDCISMNDTVCSNFIGIPTLA
ncbi:MAG: hypothetical protein IPK10_11575 [Bacteroidetes bacterium]|nr:hypothetical protein [Bacteroidota bacterium]